MVFKDISIECFDIKRLVCSPRPVVPFYYIYIIFVYTETYGTASNEVEEYF